MLSKRIKAADRQNRRKFVITSGTTITASSNTNSVAYTFPVNVKYFKVLSYDIPFGWYPVNSRNNNIRFSESAGGGTVTATLTPGNYTVAQMMTELKARLEGASPNTLTYTCTANSSTGKVTISASAGEFTLYFSQNPLSNASQLLGFTYGDLTSSGSSLTGANRNMIVRGTEDHLLICVGTSGNTVAEGGGLFHDTTPSTPTFGYIAMVPVTGSYGDHLYPGVGSSGKKYPIIASQGRGFLSSNTTTISLRYPIKKVVPDGSSETAETSEALVDLNQKPWMLVIEGELG